MKNVLKGFASLMCALVAVLPIRAQEDFTNRITNPSFENGMTGWTSYGFNAENPEGERDVDVTPASQPVDVDPWTMSNAHGEYLCDYYLYAWTGWWSFYNISQTLRSLPAGSYELTAVVASHADRVVTLFAGSPDAPFNVDGSNAYRFKKSVTTTAREDGIEVGLRFYLPDTQDVRIGVGLINSISVWEVFFKADNFRLTYLGNEPEGVTKTFTVAALNVDGLPKKILSYDINPDGPGSDGTKLISRYLASKGYDFIGVSEDFNYHGSLMESLGGYSSGTVRATLSASNILQFLDGGIDTDGLNLIWNSSAGFNASNESWERWNSTANTEGNQYIRKGFRYYTMQIDEGMLIDVYVLHMDAGEAIESRESQWAQLAQAVLNNSNTKRPKLIVGDTNSRWTREEIKTKFITPLCSRYNIGDAWVELCHDNIYPTTADYTIDDEVVDKILYLNPIETTTTLQLTPLSYLREKDYMYGQVNGNDDTTPLGDHAPVVVTFRAVQPVFDFGTTSTRWTWRGENPATGGPTQYIQNVYYSYPSSWPAEADEARAFLTYSGYMSAEPDASGLWSVWGDVSGDVLKASVSSADGHRLKMGNGNTDTDVGISTSSATTFQFVRSTLDGCTDAYHLKADYTLTRPNRYFNANGADNSYNAAEHTSVSNAWRFISHEQKAVYDRYCKAWNKGMKYLILVPMTKDRREELQSLLEANTHWQDDVTDRLEALLNGIDRWFDDDQTACIVNPSFELQSSKVELGTKGADKEHSDNHNVFGWTTAKDADEAFSAYIPDSGNIRYFDGVVGTHAFNTWGGTPAGGYFVTQTLTGVPAGYYTLRARACSDAEGNTLILKMGNQSSGPQPLNIRPASSVVELNACYHDGLGPVTIEAFSTTFFEIDDFQLLRYDCCLDAPLVSDGYGTASARFNTEIPEGLELYYATELRLLPADEYGRAARNIVHLEPYEGTRLKGGEALVFRFVGDSPSSFCRFYRTDDAVDAIDGNILQAAVQSVTSDQKQRGYDYFTLACKSTEVQKVNELTGELETVKEPTLGFFKLTAANAVPAHSAYLLVNRSSEALARQLYFLSFDDEGGNATPVQAAAEDASSHISAIWSPDGTPRQTLQRGINIVRMSDGSVRKWVKVHP